jgi:hypothetical protein
MGKKKEEEEGKMNARVMLMNTVHNSCKAID